jgi:hypothetical protein
MKLKVRSNNCEVTGDLIGLLKITINDFGIKGIIR